MCIRVQTPNLPESALLEDGVLKETILSDEVIRVGFIRYTWASSSKEIRLRDQRTQTQGEGRWLSENQGGGSEPCVQSCEQARAFLLCRRPVPGYCVTSPHQTSERQHRRH